MTDRQAQLQAEAFFRHLLEPHTRDHGCAEVGAAGPTCRRCLAEDHLVNGHPSELRVLFRVAHQALVDVTTVSAPGGPARARAATHAARSSEHQAFQRGHAGRSR